MSKFRACTVPLSLRRLYYASVPTDHSKAPVLVLSSIMDQRSLTSRSFEPLLIIDRS
jgi:hypothetical protein